MAADHKSLVERGLAQKQAGNAIVEVLGGRAIHPINVRVGGFYRAPTRRTAAATGSSNKRTLSKSNADHVAAHLVMAGRLVDADPEVTGVTQHPLELLLDGKRVEGRDPLPGGHDQDHRPTDDQHPGKCRLSRAGETHPPGTAGQKVLNSRSLLAR